MLCFSDLEPDAVPHPVSRQELEAAFSHDAGWHVVAIDPDRIRTRMHAVGAPAWLATIRRIEPRGSR